MIPVNKNPTTADLHKFGGAMILGFGVIGCVLWYFGPEPNGAAWIGASQQKWAVALWLLGLALLGVSYGPVAVARTIYVGWMTGGMYMGTVVTAVMLTLLFIVLLPLFSLIRLKDPMRLKLKPAGESYWEDHVHHESTLERTIRPF